jgi:hypothetical protein
MGVVFDVMKFDNDYFSRTYRHFFKKYWNTGVRVPWLSADLVLILAYSQVSYNSGFNVP